MTEEENQIIPEASNEMQAFLNAGGFFSQNNQIPISSSSDNSFFSEQSVSPLTSTSQNNMQGIYNEMVQNKMAEIPIVTGKLDQIQLPDVTELFKPTVSQSAQQAMQGIGDIKSRTDRIQSLETATPINTAYSTGEAEGGNVTNNSSVTNVTQVTPDYIMGLKLKYAQLPVWRQSMG